MPASLVPADTHFSLVPSASMVEPDSVTLYGGIGSTHFGQRPAITVADPPTLSSFGHVEGIIDVASHLDHVEGFHAAFRIRFLVPDLKQRVLGTKASAIFGEVRRWRRRRGEPHASGPPAAIDAHLAIDGSDLSVVDAAGRAWVP